MTEEEMKAITNDIHNSGFVALCGLECTEVDEGRCVFRFAMRDELRNPYGMAHGGVLFTAMDTAAGGASRFACGRYRKPVTLSANIHYIRPTMDGVITIEATALKAGRKTALIDVNAYDEAHTMLAHATFDMFFVDD